MSRKQIDELNTQFQEAVDALIAAARTPCSGGASRSELRTALTASLGALNKLDALLAAANDPAPVGASQPVIEAVGRRTSYPENQDGIDFRITLADTSRAD